jgi:hypothetical protein
MARIYVRCPNGTLRECDTETDARAWAEYGHACLAASAHEIVTTDDTTR